MEAQVPFVAVLADPVVHGLRGQLLGVLVVVTRVVVDGHSQVRERLAEDNLLLALQGLGPLVQNLVTVDGPKCVPLDRLPPGVDKTPRATSFSN